MFKSNLKEVSEARKAIHCLQLEVANVIALDISKKVEAAFEAIKRKAQLEDSADCEHEWIGLYGHPAAFACKKCGKLSR